MEQVQNQQNQSMATLMGRRPIYTDYDIIDESNVVDVLNRSLLIHNMNKLEIQYLYNYYKGYQPILFRTKEVRPEINNKVVENRAYEIVSFKTGYLMGEPVQYINRGKEDMADPISDLNDYMYLENKAIKDKKLAWWFHICGTGYRFILPRQIDDEDYAPFEIFTSDPRQSFVVYWSGLGHKPVMGVYIIQRVDGIIEYYCYTDSMFFKIVDNHIVERYRHILGYIPIIEYPANFARLGAFEIVITMLDAINTVSSNRMDGIEQFVQALLMFKGVDVTDEQFQSLKQQGGIKVPVDGDVKYLIQELNQTQTQTLVDYMYQTVLTICGMPNRNGGTSTSDTGVAVHIRDGWEAAENRAKDTEGMFIMSEKESLRIVKRVISTYRGTELKLASVDVRFTRRNYENILEKSQVLTTMLDSDKIAPKLAFEHCGLFIDPEQAYTLSVEYMKRAVKEKEKELELLMKSKTPEDGNTGDDKDV